MKPHALILCLAGLIALTGCASKVELQYVDPTRYRVHEYDRDKTVQVVSIWSYPPFAVGAGRNTIAIVDVVPDAHDYAALVSITHSPPFRHLNRPDSLTSAVEACARSFESQHPLWVVSTYPLVVAVGVDHAESFEHYGASFDVNGRVRLGGTARLIAEADLDALASDLLKLDTWPSDLSFASNLSEMTAQRHFDKPKSLREIIKSKLWE